MAIVVVIIVTIIVTIVVAVHIPVFFLFIRYKLCNKCARLYKDNLFFIFVRFLHKMPEPALNVKEENGYTA